MYASAASPHITSTIRPRRWARMARVSRRLVVVEDTLFIDERRAGGGAPARQHSCASLSPRQWLRLFADAGLDVVAEAALEKHHDMARLAVRYRLYGRQCAARCVSCSRTSATPGAMAGPT